ncbi:hypothetical protein RPN52_08170 [Pseudomonas putida]
MANGKTYENWPDHLSGACRRGLLLGVAGVYVLAGLGYALLAAAGSLLVAAGFIRKGLIGG